MDRKEVYLILDIERYRPPIYKVICETKEELEFLSMLNGDHSPSGDDSDSDCELESGVPPLTLSNLSKWINGESAKEDIFTEQLKRGAWPTVLTDSFRERFTFHQGAPVFLAMYCR